MSRIEEAKDTPVVSVLDQPQVAEKKSFPPRLLMMLLLTVFFVGIAAAVVLLRNTWEKVDAGDPRKVLAQQVAASLHAHTKGLFSSRRNSQ